MRLLPKLLLICLISSPALPARKTKKPAKKAPIEEKVLPTEETRPAPQLVQPIDPELAAVRSLQIKPRATYADLCRIILLQKGSFSKFQTDAERCKFTSEQDFADVPSNKDIYQTPVTLGAAASAALKAHNLEKSILFKITGMDWYALQNAEALGLVGDSTSAGDEMSGNELIVLMDEALEMANLAASWNEEENPYKDFGHENYENMYTNPAGPSVSNSDQGITQERP